MRQSNPLPRPRKGESKEVFISRFMGNETAIDDFPSKKQRAAVAYSQWDKRRKRNPGKAMSNKRNRALDEAKELYRDFTGMDVDSVEEVDIPEIDAAICVGTMDAVCYTTTRDGEVESYIHEFKENARPLLAVSNDGRVMVIIGGDFTFTDAGFEDDVPA